MRRTATVLLSAALTAGGVVAMAPAASAAITARDLSIYVTDLGPEKRDCTIDAELYVPAPTARRSSCRRSCTGSRRGTGSPSSSRVGTWPTGGRTSGRRSR